MFDAKGEVLQVRNRTLPASVTASDTNHEHVRQALGGHEITTVHELDSGDMIQAVVPIRDAEEDGTLAALVVGIHVPHRLEARLRSISQAFQEYKQLKLLKNPIKGIYILLFLLMTLIIVFSATWFGLYLARGITDPIGKLAEGTREVAAGNLRYKVEVRADDEIGILVDSFNRMTGDLAASQAKLEETYRDLQAKHNEVEQRRRYTETVLETVATGVVSLDPGGHVTTINGAAERMLGLPAAQIQGKSAAQVFRSPGVRRDRRPHPANGARARRHGRSRGAPEARRPDGRAPGVGHCAQGSRRRLHGHGAGLRGPHGAAEGAAARGVA